MSVGVYFKPHHSDLFQTNPNNVTYNRKDVQKVKRQIFGPVDHEATKLFVERELEKEITLKSDRWNFDFKHERTLNTDGLYIWRPVTPVKISRPVKRRPSTDIEFDNHELYCLPDDICRPKPVKPKIEQPTSTKNNHRTQSLITDFMQVKKNSNSSETSKKLIKRSSKIPRFGKELKS